MTKYVFAGRFGDDDLLPDVEDHEQFVPIDFGETLGRLTHGVGKALRDLRDVKVLPTEIGFDLLLLAILVQAADTRLSRSVAAQDGWTREIRLNVPVSDPPVWEGARPTLLKMLRFLTGDIWNIDFRRRPDRFRLQARAELGLFEPPNFDGVMLYSGGLDSLIGMIDAHDEGMSPLFVSYGGEGAVSRPQAILFETYREQMVGEAGVNRPIERFRFNLRFGRGLVPGVGPDNTSRGRSFMFLALGSAAGSGLAKRFDLRIPENGFIALNVPLDPTRVGSCTTRTTHPYYLHRWNDLLHAIGVAGRVANPYWDKTKGEMIAECRDQERLRLNLPLSLSCAHPSAGRFSHAVHAHCGVCVPCLIRRAAIEHAWGAGNDPTGYRVETLRERAWDSCKAEGQQIRAYEYALSRLRQRPEIASVLIHKPGPLIEDLDKLERLTCVYRQGMAEIGALLNGVRTFSSRMPDAA
jgi:hypothetical protein